MPLRSNTALEILILTPSKLYGVRPKCRSSRLECLKVPHLTACEVVASPSTVNSFAPIEYTRTNPSPMGLVPVTTKRGEQGTQLQWNSVASASADR